MSAFSALMAPPGESLSEPLSSDLTLEHGTSLGLLSAVSSFLSSTPDETFASVDPEKDWEKWAARDNMVTYYFLAKSSVTGEPQCAVRAILDGCDPSSPPPPPPPSPPPTTSTSTSSPTAKKARPSPRPRLVIDYTYTSPHCRGKGLAKQMCQYAITFASLLGANSYVLALEESCPYWMEAHGFVLEEGPNLSARLNIFPDTHLLRLATDPLDPGLPSDLAMQVEFDSDGEDDEKPPAANTRSASAPPAPAPPEAFTSALAAVKSLASPESSAALTRISQLLSNALANPARRRVSTGNKAIAQHVLAVPGTWELLMEAGWTVADEDGGDAGIKLVFDDAPVAGWIRAGLEMLKS
ncbi:hypothetical protein TeGR_g2032 [Tetraparma gracilis]|uniref:N-acetyltransferase domain-containing protein n=1 Tax=Tetraparma gracilis TaxID=2962635 RepID=A0ABQ6MJ11_9STRA|nr:hypothetical protein TeGR_g2032 [Tetraparma gracilis]